MDIPQIINQYIPIIGLGSIVTAFGIYVHISAKSRTLLKDRHDLEIASLKRDLEWAKSHTIDELVKKLEAYSKAETMGVLKSPKTTQEEGTTIYSPSSEKADNGIEEDFQEYSINLLNSGHYSSSVRAIKNLSGLRTSSSIETVVGSLLNDNFHIRQAAIKAILYISADTKMNFTESLLGIIEHASHDAAHDIAETLSILANYNDVPKITKFASRCPDEVISELLFKTVEKLNSQV